MDTMIVMLQNISEIDAEDVALVRADGAAVEEEDGLQRVERAGADVAEDDAQRSDRHDREGP